MTLRERLERAAFWHERVCADCGAATEAPQDECEECGGDRLLDAGATLSLIVMLEQESEES